MKLSLFAMPLHPTSKPYEEMLQENIEAFTLADQLGFAEAWCGEHYSTSTEPIPSPMMFYASLIAKTKHIKFCTGVTCLPHYHPAIIANHAAFFDHLSGGRFIFGIGPGGLQSDFELFETTDKDRGAMVRESISQILHLWSEDPPYNLQGKYWTTKIEDWAMPDVGLGKMVRPLQQPHPPIAVTGSSPYSGTLKGAGKNGWIPVSANFIGAWAVKSHWEVYAKAAAEAGRVADPSIWRVARSIYVADTDAEAEAFVKQRNGSFDHYFHYLYTLWDRGGIKGAYVPHPDMKPEELDSHEILRDNYVIWGSPETVAEKILAFRDEVGDFGNLVMYSHDWADREKMKRSMHLMAEQVMPMVRQGLTRKVA